MLRFLLYGNYFYGLCAIALSLEAGWQQMFPANPWWYYLCVFLFTVLYYSYPYVRRSPVRSTNPRTNWYTDHYQWVRYWQIGSTVVLTLAMAMFIFRYWTELLHLPVIQWMMIAIFPFVGALYYGSSRILGKYNLRRIGWLKPFVIGFAWAGFVTVYPVLFYSVINRIEFRPELVRGLLFLKNFMFVTTLCIMFDIKDYRSDYIHRLKTFVVKVGLRRTIFSILVPLVLIGLGSFVYYAIDRQFSPVRIILNIVPFALLLWVAYSLRKRRSLLYYLGVVDGLMLVKAICGCVAILLFD